MVLAAFAFAAGRPDAQAPARVVAPDSSAEKGAKDSGEARLEISGKVMLDMILDFNRVDPQWHSTLRPSTIPSTCPGDPGCGKDGETIFSVRQTSLTIKGFVPTEIGMLKTDLSMDLFGTGTSNVGGAATQIPRDPRLGEMGAWAGQHESLFMNLDVFPNVIDYWGPNGNVFLRNPQLRYTTAHRGRHAAAVLARGAELRARQRQDADLHCRQPARATKYPDLVAKYVRDGGRAVLRLGHRRWVGWETTNTASNDPSGNVTGGGVNLNGWLNPPARTASSATSSTARPSRAT